MKRATVLAILLLENCCFFLAAGSPRRKIDCSQVKYRPNACTRFAPVCGTDGKTSDNKCALCAQIKNGADIDLAFEGKCVDCRKYPQPPVGDCPNEYKPICGTDGNIYPHLCVLCARIWVTGQQIGVNPFEKCT